MEKRKVWTKQNAKVLEELERTGRYIAKKQYIIMDLQEHAELVLETYEWLVRHGPDAGSRPSDVQFPVWVSFSQEATMMHEEGTVILALEVDPRIITTINVAKWGAILNYSYIPSDPRDFLRHQKLLDSYGISDAKALMTPFYPEIRREIMGSWDRLFDDSIQLGGPASYGNIWEIRREWITHITR